jgi:hypothetical protein
VRDQTLSDTNMPILGGEQQGAITVVCPMVDVGSRSKDAPHGLIVSAFGG